MSKNEIVDRWRDAAAEEQEVFRAWMVAHQIPNHPETNNLSLQLLQLQKKSAHWFRLMTASRSQVAA